MQTSRVISGFFLTMILLACLSSTGCVGALAQLFYVIKGHQVPAQYSGFEGKKVAVVINTDASSYGPDSLSKTFGKYVRLKLATNIEDIEIVPELEIKNWIDINGYDESKLAKLGKSVEADFVLAIDVDNYTIRDGKTIYKGQSDITLSVIESESGDVTYSFGPENMVYPENGRPAIQTTDRKFEMFYLTWLTRQISRQFYKHDKLDEVADDAAFAG